MRNIALNFVSPCGGVFLKMNSPFFCAENFEAFFNDLQMLHRDSRHDSISTEAMINIPEVNW